MATYEPPALPPDLGVVCDTCGLSEWTRSLDRPAWRREPCHRCPYPTPGECI